jgi:hypothetical protein
MMSHDTITGRRPRLLAAVIALACGLATPVSAEVHVEGNLSGLRVTTSDDALSDVLTAFGARWPVRYRSSVPLDVKIAGAYSGSMLPPPGIAQLWNFSVFGSKRTTVLGVEPDSLYQMTSEIAEMPQGSDFGPLGDGHSVTLPVAVSSRPR